MTEHALRVVLVGYGPVGARFVDELLPAVRSGRVDLTVVGAEAEDAYNRVLIAEYAVGRIGRETLDLTDSAEALEAGARILTGVCALSINRSRRTVTVSDGNELPYDRVVLATGARANVPTLDGVVRVRRDHLRPPLDPTTLDSADGALPRGITALRDLADAELVRLAVAEGRRIVVLGAGVLGMEIALAAARAGAEVCVVYHGDAPMARNLDRGGGRILARAARDAGVAMVDHSRAESVLLRLDDDGVARFDALICADGKQIAGDLLLLSCGVGARVELARLAGLEIAAGIVVDETLQSWTDPRIYAIGDCAQLAPRPEPGQSEPRPRAEGGPAGLIGPGWRQADWLAAAFAADAAGGSVPARLDDERPAIVMLKDHGIDVVAVGDAGKEPWDDFDGGTGRDAHAEAFGAAPLRVSSWADPEHGRYVKMVTRSGVLEAFVCVGMPRTGAELTLLFDRSSELPADRSVLLRYDGPDYEPTASGDDFAPDATVCWCNGVTAGAIGESAAAGNTTVECIGKATRAGTGCGGCKGRIAELLARFAESEGPSELVG